MTQKISVDNSKPDRVYINCQLFNNTNQYVSSVFNQTRATSFLDCPENYNLGIVKLTVSQSDIPRINLNLPPSLQPTLSVSLGYNGVIYPTALTIPTLIGHLGSSDKAIYDIQTFVNIVNEGYLQCQADLLAAVPALIPVLTFGTVFLSYNAATQLFEFLIPDTYGEGVKALVPGDGISVGMSYDLSQKLASFPTFEEYPITGGAADVLLIRKWNGTNQRDGTDFRFTPPIAGGGNYMSLIQDCAYPASILDINSLIVTTTSLPIINEYKNYNNFGVNESSNKTIAQITDFAIGQTAPIMNRGDPYNYLPPFYRLTSLTGTKSLFTFDFQLYIQDRYNNEPQLLRLPPRGTLNLKAIFLKKGLSN